MNFFGVHTVINRAELETMFENMRTKSKWNVDGDLIWGFFFTDASRKKLEKAAKELGAMDYDFVGIFKDEETQRFCWLHMEKVETHTVDSIEKRNKELDAFAKKFGLESYDGMDASELLTDDE